MQDQTAARESKKNSKKPEETPSKRARELDEAVERLWRKYGNDLPAFQRDVQRELEKHNQGDQEN